MIFMLWWEKGSVPIDLWEVYCSKETLMKLGQCSKDLCCILFYQKVSKRKGSIQIDFKAPNTIFSNVVLNKTTQHITMDRWRKPKEKDTELPTTQESQKLYDFQTRTNDKDGGTRSKGNYPRPKDLPKNTYLDHPPRYNKPKGKTREAHLQHLSKGNAKAT